MKNYIKINKKNEYLIKSLAFKLDCEIEQKEHFFVLIYDIYLLDSRYHDILDFLRKVELKEVYKSIRV